jgi:hypothetical protein
VFNIVDIFEIPLRLRNLMAESPAAEEAGFLCGKPALLGKIETSGLTSR